MWSKLQMETKQRYYTGKKRIKEKIKELDMSISRPLV